MGLQITFSSWFALLCNVPFPQIRERSSGLVYILFKLLGVYADLRWSSALMRNQLDVCHHHIWLLDYPFCELGPNGTCHDVAILLKNPSTRPLGTFGVAIRVAFVHWTVSTLLFSSMVSSVGKEKDSHLGVFYSSTGQWRHTPMFSSFSPSSQ